jgi:hypothetical protein
MGVRLHEQHHSVYDGRQLVGWVLARGRRGFEAFTAGERSLGMFKTQDAAISACMKKV